MTLRELIAVLQEKKDDAAGVDGSFTGKEQGNIGMKQVKVIGIGMGSRESLTVEGFEWLKECEVYMGAERMIQAAKEIAGEKKSVAAYQPEILRAKIENCKETRIAVLMSGDLGFFSGASGLRKALCGLEGCSISWIPGISCLVYFCNKLGVSYEDVFIASKHGRELSVCRIVACHKKTFLLCDGDLYRLGEQLIEYGLRDVTVYVGVDLSYQTEAIRKLSPDALMNIPKEENYPLSVCLIINHRAEELSRVNRKDEEFLRGRTPMTKEEVRSIILSKLSPGEEDIIYDVGGGTGSVSISAAIAAWGGKVYSVECDPEGVRLIDANRKHFACDNVEIIYGRAPQALLPLPFPDRVFIGGSKGAIREIISCLEDKLHRQREQDMEKYSIADMPLRKIPVVISAISLETVSAVLELWKKPGFTEKEICQISVSKGEQVGNVTMLKGQNPITIFSMTME